MFRSLGPFVLGLGFRVYCRGTSFKACLLSGPLATLFSRCQLAWFNAKIYGTKRIILWLVVASHMRFIGLHLGDAIPHSRPQYRGFGQTKQTNKLIRGVLKIMDPLWLLTILRHELFRGTKMEPKIWELPICQTEPWWERRAGKKGTHLNFEIQRKGNCNHTSC